MAPSSWLRRRNSSPAAGAQPFAASHVHAGYQPEIDGLRAVAVLSVLFYHVGFSSLGGGYVGVDVFFVISGFLITRLIVKEVQETGRFGFINFYVRRVRRLFPAMLATVAVSFLFSALLLSPEQMRRFAISAGATPFSISNFLFWYEADYFDALASTKPLLHTWSLSVEEQFYLVWPALLVLLLLCRRRWMPFTMLAGLSVLSLALAQYWLGTDRAAAFYLLPARVMELGLGGLLVWLVRFRPPPLLAEGMLALGLGLIVYSCLTYTEETFFPGLAALVPCLGAALVISFCTAPSVGTLLRLPPVVWVGKISYSLYLVHWPIVVFYEAYLFRDLDLSDRWMVIGLSMILATVQYYLIEQRFRYERPGGLSQWKILGTAASMAVVVGMAAYSVILTGGWPGRIPEARLHPMDRTQRLDQQQQFCRRPDPSKPAHLFTCQNYRDKPKDIVIWGDSHALHLVSGFSNVLPDYNIFVMFMASCTPQSGLVGYDRNSEGLEALRCVERNRAAMEYFKTSPPTDIVISSAKRDNPAEVGRVTNAIVAELSELGHEITVLGDIIRPGRHLNDCITVPELIITNANIAKRCTPNENIAKNEQEYNKQFSSVVRGLISFDSIQCPENRCMFFDRNTLLFRDDHHLNIQGSTFFVEKIKDQLPF